MAPIWRLRPLDDENNNVAWTQENSQEQWQCNITKGTDQQYSADTKHGVNPMTPQEKKKKKERREKMRELVPHTCNTKGHHSAHLYFNFCLNYCSFFEFMKQIIISGMDLKEPLLYLHTSVSIQGSQWPHSNKESKCFDVTPVNKARQALYKTISVDAQV